MTTVRTETDLRAAVESELPEIRIEGELAEAVHRRRTTKKRFRLGGLLLAVAGVCAAPFTGGASLGMTATEVGLLSVAALTVGAGLIASLSDAYDEVEFSVGPTGARVKLKRKKMARDE